MRYTVRQLMYRYVHETHVRTREAVQVYSHIERTSSGYIWMHTDCQSIHHVFILTEVEASALNCGHNVLDARAAQVEGES